MYHVSAVKVMTTPQKDIGELLSKKHHDDKQLNGRMLMNIIQDLQYLGRQGIPIRGHIDAGSNFIQLLKLRSNDQKASIKIIKQHIDKCKFCRILYLKVS